MMISQVKVYPEMFDLIRFLKRKGIRMAIGTGTLRQNAEMIIGENNLSNYIDALVSADEITKPKPDPETFIKAANAIGCMPENCAVFEDAPLGLQAAQNGGFTVFKVKNGIPGI